MNYLTAKDLKDHGTYKYIRMEDDSFRFIGIYQNHSDTVAEGEKAKSAGMIGIIDDRFMLVSPDSMTLKVRTEPDDMKLLEHVLDKLYYKPRT